jgi:uncharacterized tellurite resistance protein B-like protein
MEKSYKEKLSTLCMLVKIIKADNHIKDEELSFFIRVAKTLKVSEEDYTHVFENEQEFAPPKREVSRVVLFHNLLLLAYIDKKIGKEEIQLCHEMGLKLGLNSAAVTDILNKLQEQPQAAIDPFRIDRVFKRYLN